MAVPVWHPDCPILHSIHNPKCEECLFPLKKNPNNHDHYCSKHPKCKECGASQLKNPKHHMLECSQCPKCARCGYNHSYNPNNHSHVCHIQSFCDEHLLDDLGDVVLGYAIAYRVD
jgi:hypothetical protein